MKLGACDVCLRVTDVRVSREFYGKLGFSRVEGTDSDDWGVLTNGQLRLGLFEARYMGMDSVSLNFRGGDVLANVEELGRAGVLMEKGPVVSTRGCSASLRDPDGYLIFLDTSIEEAERK